MARKFSPPRGDYIEVSPEGSPTNAPSPLKVKEVMVEGRRCIVCLNIRQARKDVFDREAMIEALKEKIRAGARGMIGNKGCRKFLKIESSNVSSSLEKIETDKSSASARSVLETAARFSRPSVSPCHRRSANCKFFAARGRKGSAKADIYMRNHALSQN